ncbi:MAG: FIST C-terminal domain-containing protein [Polyangiaceae bacterium]
MTGRPPPFSSNPPAGSRSQRPASVLAASSFCVLGSDPHAIGGALDEVRAAVPMPSAALVFAAGPLAEMGDKTLSALRAELGDIPIVLASSTGVLTERAEHEGASALSGIVWGGGSITPIFVAPKTATDEITSALATQVSAALGDAAGTVILMAQPQGFAPHSLDDLARFSAHATVIGGGTLPGGAWISAPDRTPMQGAVVGVTIRGVARPQVRTSAAVRLLTPFSKITESRGAMVFRIGEERALDALSAATRDLPGRPLILAVLANTENPASARGGVLVRGIRGIDPGRKSVVVTDEATPGMLMSFAVCDANAARADLSGTMRDLARQLAGAAPQFGLLLSCAGRGMGLYGERDVDTRIVRERFPNVPFAGMFSTFEIGPLGPRPAMHLYTSVVAMFGTPS